MLRRALKLLVLLVAALLVLAGGVWLYARCLEPRWVEETHWELRAPHWKGRPLRVAVLSDLHARSGDGAYLDSLVQRILEARPDAVFLLGDYIHERSLGDTMEADVLGQHLAPLGKVPCFAVLGNHDYSYGAAAVRRMLQGWGAQVVDGEMHALHAGGSILYIGGIRCQSHFRKPGRMPALPDGVETSATLLMLTHSPAGAHHVPAATTATVCGHTHGGQVCLPGGIPLVRPDNRVAWEEMKGSISVKGKPVYVSRGLGMSGPPLRFCCRPELVWVELRGTGQGE